MLNAWPAEFENVNTARVGRNSLSARTAVTTVVQEHGTTTSITLNREWRADSPQRSSACFMEALGGEVRPDAEAEAAFATVRSTHIRPATAVRRRSGPPLAVAEAR